jgi:hypothetical protein
MPTHYPPDRFDHLPHSLDRVGAHRAPARRGRHWVTFWWAVASTVVLIALGAVGLSAANNRLSFEIPGISTSTATGATDPASAVATDAPAPVPTPVPTAVPTVDPSLTVTVLNGTPRLGVAKAVGEVLTAAGWTVGALSNASTETVATTVVYYADATLEGAARGAAESVPGATVLLTGDFSTSGASLTVVVGNDYSPEG